MFKWRAKAGSVDPLRWILEEHVWWTDGVGRVTESVKQVVVHRGCVAESCPWSLQPVQPSYVTASPYLFSPSHSFFSVHFCGCKCQSIDWGSVLGYNVVCNQIMHSSPTYIIPGEMWMVGLLQQFPSALNLPSWIWPYIIWALWGLGAPPPLDWSKGEPKLPWED